MKIGCVERAVWCRDRDERKMGLNGLRRWSGSKKGGTNNGTIMMGTIDFSEKDKNLFSHSFHIIYFDNMLLILHDGVTPVIAMLRRYG